MSIGLRSIFRLLPAVIDWKRHWLWSSQRLFWLSPWYTFIYLLMMTFSPSFSLTWVCTCVSISIVLLKVRVRYVFCCLPVSWALWIVTWSFQRYNDLLNGFAWNQLSASATIELVTLRTLYHQKRLWLLLVAEELFWAFPAPRTVTLQHTVSFVKCEHLYCINKKATYFLTYFLVMVISE